MMPDQQKSPTIDELMARMNSPEALAARQEADKLKPPQEKKKLVAKMGEGGGGRHDWAKGLYHIRFNNRIFRYGNAAPWTQDSFNGEFGIKDPRTIEGKPLEPSVYLRKIVGYKMSVDNAAYAAGLPEVFEFGGMKFVNLFHPNSIPETAVEYTPEGQDHVDRLRRHILLMCDGNETYAHIIESWIALNIREPGRLVGWAIMMKGIQGDGKSTIFELMMASLLGQSNVGLVSSKEIKTDFNAWAYGKAYRHMPELKAAGSSRYEVEDTLKPHVTDSTVRMIGKGANGEEVPNRTNYVGTTNHEDSMPLSNDDRRWFIIFTPWRSKDEMVEIIGCDDHDEYFDKLIHAARECGPWMRKYMLELELHPSVFHGSRAMDTEYKARMVQAEYTNAGGEDFDSWIEEGCFGISTDVVIPKVLHARLVGAVGIHSAPRQKTLASLIRSRGYYKVDPRIKWRTTVRTVYIRNKKLADRANVKDGDNEANDEIRRLLDMTVPKEALTYMSNTNESENIKAYEEAMLAVWAGKSGKNAGF